MSNGDDDMSGLGLSLGLGCGVAENQNQNPNRNQMNQYPQPSLKLNLMPFPSFFAQINHHRTSLNDLFQSADRNIDTRSFQRVPDMNRMPQVIECDDEAGVSSPNSTISSLSGKRSEREQVGGCEEAEAERTSCSQGGSDDEDGGGAGDGDGDGDASRKKLRLSKEQSILLEETFKEHNTLNPKQKLALAKQLNLRPRQVEVWFQNRRARTKLKQTEVDCEYLKRCCENLTQENRRLQKEVQELRALKLSPQLYMHMNPPTTLTMCPSCERVAVASSSTSAAAASNRHPVNPQPQRPMPIKAWAALPINQHRSIDSPASRS